MSTIEFQAWPKIARLYRDCVITEKIDGTEAAVGIQVMDDHSDFVCDIDRGEVAFAYLHGMWPPTPVAVYAQSRKRLINPKMDNHGFARWVWEHAQSLVDVLGPGVHHGEWWGSGIQRGYGLPKGEKRFSLFNTKRWQPNFNCRDQRLIDSDVPGLCVVPVLYDELFDTAAVDRIKEHLRTWGSVAAPGFMNPEGIVVYHTAARVMFKSTLENDEVPKEVAARRQNAEEVARVLDVPKNLVGLAA